MDFVDIGDFSYGQWIIYDNGIPSYHVDVFDKNFASNVQLLKLLENKQETIQSIIAKINTKENIQLSFGHKPTIEIIKKSELVKLDLKPIPENWVLNIS
ncbi:MAG: hypothetical protein V4456_22665 [Bacteroidota bacterium]